MTHGLKWFKGCSNFILKVQSTFTNDESGPVILCNLAIQDGVNNVWVGVKSLEKSLLFYFESNGGFNFGVFMLNFSCELPNKALLFTVKVFYQCIRLSKKLTILVYIFGNHGSRLCKVFAVLQLWHFAHNLRFVEIDPS